MFVTEEFRLSGGDELQLKFNTLTSLLTFEKIGSLLAKCVLYDIKVNSGWSYEAVVQLGKDDVVELLMP